MLSWLTNIDSYRDIQYYPLLPAESSVAKSAFNQSLPSSWFFNNFAYRLSFLREACAKSPHPVKVWLGGICMVMDPPRELKLQRKDFLRKVAESTPRVLLAQHI